MILDGFFFKKKINYVSRTAKVLTLLIHSQRQASTKSAMYSPLRYYAYVHAHILDVRRFLNAHKITLHNARVYLLFTRCIKLFFFLQKGRECQSQHYSTR